MANKGNRSAPGGGGGEGKKQFRNFNNLFPINQDRLQRKTLKAAPYTFFTEEYVFAAIFSNS